MAHHPYMKNLVHTLKCYPAFFVEVKTGSKTFEVRKNDRGFQVGDEILLHEFVPQNYYEDQVIDEYYTGQVCHRKITYVLPGGQFGIEPGYVVIGLQPI